MTLALLVGWAVPAHAQQSDFTGSVWSTWQSRAWYTNTGLFATTGSAFLILPEISHTPTGLYAGLFMSIPTQDSIGAELDARVGKVWKIGGFDLDTRVAWYHFNGPGNVIADIANTRMVGSREFKLGKGTSITPYAVADLQRIFNPAGDLYVALAGGVGLKHLFADLPGTPTLRTNAEVWQYVATPTPATPRVPIMSLVADFGFKPWNNNVSIGPRGTIGLGDITGQSIVRATAGVVIRASFN